MKYCIAIRNRDKCMFDGRDYIPYYRCGKTSGAFMYLKTPDMEIELFDNKEAAREYIKRDDPKLFIKNRNEIEIVEADDILLWYAEDKLRWI